MKNVLYSLTALTLLSSALICADEKTAVTTATPATIPAPTKKQDFTNVKIAFMDPYGVLDKSKEWEAQAETIKADFESRAKAIQAMDAERQKLETELANMGNAATASARENKQKKLLSLQSEIEIEKRAAQEIPQQRAQMAQMEILKKIEAAAQKIAKELGIDVILAGSTIYTNERIDITQLIADELNKSYKPAPKAVKPAATPAKPAAAKS